MPQSGCEAEPVLVVLWLLPFPALPLRRPCTVMYCVATSFLIELPVLSVPFRSWVTPRSHSYDVVSFEMWFVPKESCAYRRVHPPSAVG